MSVQPKDTIVCFMCKGFVSYKDNDPKKFHKHMNSEHMAYFGLDYLLAGSCMSEEERGAVREVIKDRIEPSGKRKEDGTGSKAPLRRSTDSPSLEELSGGQGGKMPSEKISKKQQCPKCPIAFTFQVDLIAHIESSHTAASITNVETQNTSKDILDGIDSKQDKVLMEKMKKFSSASQELRKSSRTSPENIKREVLEGGRVKGLAVRKFGPALGMHLSKEEAWKLATKSKRNEEGEAGPRRKDLTSTTSVSKKPELRSNSEAAPLNELKKKLKLTHPSTVEKKLNQTTSPKPNNSTAEKRLNQTTSPKTNTSKGEKKLHQTSNPKTTPLTGKKKSKQNKSVHIDRSRGPDKELAGATDDPGSGTTCPLCKKEFPKNGPMRRHFEDIHQPGEYPCPGEGCGKVFTSKNKMSSHRSRNCNPNNPKGGRKSI